MLKFGLIGYPISHSGSPRLFRERYGDICSYDLVEEQDFSKAWDTFLNGYDAINVTAPFKKEAYLRSDIRSKDCEAAGAANLLVNDRAGGHIQAFNTDVAAVEKILSEVGARKVLVVGAGGAGRAAAVAAGKLGLDFAVCNRTPAEGVEPLAKMSGLAASCDTIVYAVPVKLDGTDSFAGKIVIEPNYRNPQLKGLECKYVGGEQWLRLQASAGFAVLDRLFLSDTIAFLGFMGSGKTTLGRALADALGVRFFDLDEAVEMKAGAGIPEIFATAGESAFRELEARCLREILDVKGRKVVALGGGTLLNGSCAAFLQEKASRIYLQASPGCLLSHLGGDWEAASASRPLLVKGNPCELIRSRSAVYEANADVTVCVDEKDVKTLIDEIINIHYICRLWGQKANGC